MGVTNLVASAVNSNQRAVASNLVASSYGTPGSVVLVMIAKCEFQLGVIGEILQILSLYASRKYPVSKRFREKAVGMIWTKIVARHACSTSKRNVVISNT